MRTKLTFGLVLLFALSLCGCAKRTHEDLQRELTEAAEQTADGYASGDEAALDQAAERLKALSAEAKELGEPPEKTKQRLQVKYGERQRKAAEKLQAEASAK